MKYIFAANLTFGTIVEVNFKKRTYANTLPGNKMTLIIFSYPEHSPAPMRSPCKYEQVKVCPLYSSTSICSLVRTRGTGT